MLYGILGYLPHSSSDPFGATFPPGEGFGGYFKKFPVIYTQFTIIRYDSKEWRCRRCLDS